MGLGSSTLISNFVQGERISCFNQINSKEETLNFMNMKKLLYYLMALYFFQPVLVMSQIPDWNWARGSLGTLNGDNGGRKIKVGVSGNVFVLGEFLDDSVTFGNITLHKQELFNGGANNFFLLKYDSYGNLLFAKNPCIGDFNGFGFDIDSNDNLFVSGYFTQDSAIVDGITLFNTDWSNTGVQHIFLSKFDSEGNLIWIKSNDNIGLSYTRSVQVNTSGDIFVFGDCCGADSIRFDNMALAINDSASYLFIVKFNQSGEPIWITKAKGNNQGLIIAGGLYAIDINTDSSGNIFIAGNFSTPYLVFDTIMIINNHPPGWWTDIFIAKYNSSGNILWAKSEGGHNQNGDGATALKTVALGNVILTGYYTPSSTFDTLFLTDYGSFISQYGPTGNLNWLKTISGDNSSRTSDVSVDANGNSYITGYFNGDSISFGSSVLYNNANTYVSNPNCMFIIKFDSQGNVLGAKKGAGFATGNSLSVNSLGDIYLTGSFGRDSLILDSHMLTNNNSYYTTFTGRLGNSSNLIDHTEKNDLIILYPNPAYSYINVFFYVRDIQRTTFRFYNSTGMEVSTFKESGNCQNYSKAFNISHLVPGLYFIEIDMNGEKTVKEFVKE